MRTPGEGVGLPGLSFIVEKKSDTHTHSKHFQVEEDKKNTERLTDLIDKLQGKLKVYKRQMEEAVLTDNI